MSDWTVDRPAPGVVIHQPRRGFRYGSEAFWLVGFALEEGRPATALDLGTGSGIAALLLAGRGLDAIGVDVRAEWAGSWARSLADSRVAGTVRLEVADVVGGGLPTVDLVVSNPPFFPTGSGPEPEDPWRRAARFEGTATLGDFVRQGVGALAPGGRAVFVVPREREEEVIAAAPPGWGACRVARVGRRRSLVELALGPVTPHVEAVDERGARALSWVATATLATVSVGA